MQAPVAAEDTEAEEQKPREEAGAPQAEVDKSV